MQGLINNMVGNTNTATVVENNNKTTTVSKSRKAKPIVVHENNNGAVKLADTGLKSNNTLGAHVVEEKEGWFYKWADNYDVWNDYSYTPTNENEPGSSHTFTGDNSILNSPKPNTTGNRQQKS